MKKTMLSAPLPKSNLDVSYHPDLTFEERDALYMYGTNTHVTEMVLKPVEKSRLHLLVDAMKAGKVLLGAEGRRITEHKGKALILTEALGVFLLNRDWVSVLGDSLSAETIGEDFNVPYPHCIFEMNINGFHHIAVYFQENGEKASHVNFTDYKGHWIVAGKPGMALEVAEAGFDGRGVVNTDYFAHDQVRALCVALDVNLAKVGTPVQPSRLKSQIQKDKGKTPTFRYSVVDLNGRRTSVKGALHEATGRKVRLHFRRGHWRHLAEDCKTWVKWCLAGSPEVGVVDHHYEA